MKSTMEPIVDIRPGRAVGNTTRQVDKAIQWLFEGETVLVIDHNNSRDSNEQLLSIIVNRFKIEHRRLKDILIITKKRGDITIKLKV